MDSLLFLRGLVFGFSIAAPVGPIGILCIQRTLTRGWLVGLLSGLGAATADATYGVLAASGVTLISGILVDQAFWFKLVGGLFLVYLGVTHWRSRPAEKAALAEEQGLLGAYLSTVVLTLTNPLTIASFAAVFAGLGLASAAGSPVAAIALVLGVFVGSALWWLVLSSGVSLLRTKFNARALRWVNKVSGLVLIVFGIVALFSAVS
jgi:threonine/homoserine/homoserine lactone efflux protein